MSLTSLQFLLLVAICIPIYYLVPKKIQWVVLLAAGYIFYTWGGWQTVGYLLFTTATTYLAGVILGTLNQKIKEREKSQTAKLKLGKKATVLVALLLNFGMLYTLKYWDYMWEVLRQPQLSLGLVLPLGVSFFIFQSAGYVVDCYRGKVQPEKNPLKYALFVSFFPQMTQGPIGRFDHLSPQLLAERKFSADAMKFGIQLMLWGYMKKLIIADRAAVVVNTVFNDPTAYGGIVIAFAVLMYCIQLYCDFSGGIDIIRGTAQTFGIEMAENFRRPIFATSLTDYWRRWHITLGQWMKDYVFYSMALSKPILKLGKFTRRKIGGRLGKIIPTSICTFTIYFIIGIWHGASFTFIAFGFYNGILITAALLLENRFAKIRSRLGAFEESCWMRWFRMARTWVIVFAGRYLTRAATLGISFEMLRRTIFDPCVYQVFDGTFWSLGLVGLDYAVIVIGMAVLLAAEWYQERGGHIRAALETKPVFVQWLAIVLPLILIVAFGLMRGDYIQTEFIYQQY